MGRTVKFSGLRGDAFRSGGWKPSSRIHAYFDSIAQKDEV